MSNFANSKLTMYLLGPFRLVNAQGENCTPRGRKSCALLALLALSPHHQRARKWVQDKLWSDRSQEHGAASLRQCLREIRRSLGSDADCLQSDRSFLSLDTQRLQIDIELGENSRTQDDLELLEGLEVKDPEFENWLRDQRMRFENSLDSAEPTFSDLPPPSRPREFSSRKPANRFQLVLTSRNNDASAESQIISDTLGDIVGKSLSEVGAIEVFDHRNLSPAEAESNLSYDNAQTFALQSEIINSGSGSLCRLALTAPKSNQVIWSTVLHKKSFVGVKIDDPDILCELNQVVDVTLGEFIRNSQGNIQDKSAMAYCSEGIRTLFKLGDNNFLQADHYFAEAFNRDQRGIYLAWRAFLRTFLLAERQYTCRETVVDEAVEYMNLAIEKEPYNSHVLGLCAHVQNIVRRSYFDGYELAKRSTELNKANSLGWACLGVAESYLGRTEHGYRNTRLAKKIAGMAPFKYQIDALCCITGTMAGEFDEALRYGELSHTSAPHFAPPLRYLAALYLHAENPEKSYEMVEKLRELEPDFSYQMLKEKNYPTAGLHRSELLDLIPGRQI